MRLNLNSGLLIVCLLVLSGCDFLAGKGSENVEQARVQYQQTQDIDSLQTLHKQLKQGLTRSEVEALLGAAQYSPTEGVDYYPVAQDSPQQQSANTGLVVEYINDQAEATDQVQRFWLGEVGE